MAKHSHKRDTRARLFSSTPRPRPAVLAGSFAVLATASTVSLGVLGAGTTTISPSLLAASLPPAVSGPTAGDSTPAGLELAGEIDRRGISRGAVERGETRQGERAEPTAVDLLLRSKATKKAIRAADTEQFTTEILNLWLEPGDQARQDGEIDAGKKVLLTGRSFNGRDEIVIGDQTRWVTSGYFSDEKPDAEPTLGGACVNGTSVASGVSPNIVKVHTAVCASFPEITTYGTFRSDGEHAQGIAVDIMVSGDRGYQVAEFVRANAAALGVNYVIYAQRIWSVERSSEGWRAMASRGSITANHYDHVHVTTY